MYANHRVYLNQRYINYYINLIPQDSDFHLELYIIYQISLMSFQYFKSLAGFFYRYQQSLDHHNSKFNFNMCFNLKINSGYLGFKFVNFGYFNIINVLKINSRLSGFIFVDFVYFNITIDYSNYIITLLAE